MEDKLILFITDQLKPEEKLEILDWISVSNENKEEYYKLKNLWALSVKFNSPKTPSDVDMMVFQRNLKRRKIKTIKLWAYRLTKYAAIVLFAMILGAYLFKHTKYFSGIKISYSEIIVPAGQITEVKLSDGTDVFINSCTKFKYPDKFNIKERKVFLSGEAFFNVHTEKTPFIVETSKGKVRVYGTKFNVKAYPQNSLMITTLKEGMVAVLDSLDSPAVKLKQGEQCIYNTSDNSFVINSVETDLYDSWKEGIYVFDRETLETIAERLEMIFDVHIVIENNNIRDYKFTGTISRNIPFEQILKIIQISAPIKYQLIEKHGAITEVKLY